MFRISPEVTRNERDIENAQFLFRATDEYYRRNISSFSCAAPSESLAEAKQLSEVKRKAKLLVAGTRSDAQQLKMLTNIECLCGIDYWKSGGLMLKALSNTATLKDGNIVVNMRMGENITFTPHSIACTKRTIISRISI